MNLLRALAMVFMLALSLSSCEKQPNKVTGASGGTAASQARSAQQQGRHDLSLDEARGGHTLQRHVGRSDEELRERLRRERNISAASTYTDRETAEMVIARVLAEDRERIRTWSSRGGRRPNLVLDFHGDAGHPIGRSMGRGDSAAQPCFNAVVVLKADGDSYYVLTSYPESR